MLFSKVLQLLAIAGTALARTVLAKTNTHLAIRQDSGDIEALERAANSRLRDVLQNCPFDVNAVAPVARPLFDDWLVYGESSIHCANLTQVPADASKLYISIITGTQVPIIVPAENITFNGTVIELDADYPKKQDIFEGLVMVSLIEATEAKPEEKTADWVSDRTLASAFIQVQQALDGDDAAPVDIICPRAGGTLFWDFISA